MTTNETPTPRNDAADRFSAIDYQLNADIPCVRADFARQLERELNEAKKRITILERRPMTAEEICQPGFPEHLMSQNQ